MSDAGQQATAGPEDELAGRGLLEQVRAVWKQRYLVLAVAAVVTALVALWTLRQPKIYAASVSVEFDPNPPRPLGSAVQSIDSQEETYWSTREYYTTQFYIIRSERVSEGVVRQLGLQHDADFLGVSLAGRRAFRSVTVTEAAQVLRERTHVDPVRDSRVVTISVDDTNPRRAQLLANTIASVYIHQNLEHKLSTTVSALEWLGQQLDSLRVQLDTSEMGLHRYRSRNNLLSVSFEDRRNHVGNRIESLSKALTEAQTHRMSVESRVTELRRAAVSHDPLAAQAPELLSSSVLQSLRGAYEQGRRERDALATRYLRNSLQMMAAEGKLNEMNDAIRHEVRNIVGAAESDLRAVIVDEADLQAALTEAQHEGLDLNLKEIEYGSLLRERDNYAKLYGLVLERTKETDLTRLLRVNNVRVLDDALLPGAPVRPRTVVNISIGFLAGVVLGIALAVALLQADRTVRSPHDIQDVLHATFLGLIPRIQSGTRSRYRYRYSYNYSRTGREPETPVTNPDLVVHTHPTSAVAEACRVIRTNLLFMSPDTPFQALMIASGDPQEGKTTVAISLALTLAQSGKRVLLIDTDLRRPRIHRSFKIRPPVGITSVLVNEATLDEATLDSEVPNLWLLPCGPIPPNPAELLQSQRFIDLLKLARQKYDRIVFDTPPVGVVTDAMIIASQVDGAVLVVRSRSTLRTRAASVLAQLHSLRARVIGVILNDVQVGREGGGSAYYYYAQNYEYGTSHEPV